MPLHELVASLGREASEAGVVGDLAWLSHVRPYLAHHPDHCRIDLKLLAYICLGSNRPRPDSTRELVDVLYAAIASLEAGELGPDLVAAISCINPYVLPEAASLSRRVRCDVLEAMRLAPRSRNDEDEVLRICCLPAATLFLRQEKGNVRVAFEEIACAIYEIKRVTALFRTSDAQSFPLNERGGFDLKCTSWRIFGPSGFVLTIHVLLGIQGILDALFGNVIVNHQETQPSAVAELLDFARRLQRKCLNTLRHLRALNLPESDALDAGVSLEVVESGMLALLAQLERICGDFRAAVQVAIAALMQAPANVQDFHLRSHYRSLQIFLSEQGVWNSQTDEADFSTGDPFERLQLRLHRRLSELRRDLQAVDPCKPTLAMIAYSATHAQAAECLGVFARHGVRTSGWGEKTFQFVRNQRPEAELRAAAVILAARTGSLWSACSFFNVADPKRQIPNEDFARAHRNATAVFLGEKGVVALACEVARTAQYAALWIDNAMGNKFKNGLRKLMNKCPLNILPNPMERLFVNHVRVGIGYRCCAPEEIEGDSDQEVVRLAERRLAVDPFTMTRFGQGILTMDSESVFVSLVTVDGDSLALTFVSRRGDGQISVSDPRKVEAKKDWVKLLEDLAKSEDLTASGLLNVKLSGPIHTLCWEVFAQSLRLNPGVKRILLHAEPIWDVIPWNFVLNRCLKEQVSRRLAGCVEARQRREEDDLIAVWRVPGVRTPNALTVAPLPPRQFVFDSTDARFSEIEDQVMQSTGSSRNSLRGHLSILAHGQVRPDKASAQLVFNGEPIHGEALARRHHSFPLVCLHVCYAARLGKERYERYSRDDSALPNAFFATGARYVIAPGLALPLEPGLIQTLENCLAKVRDMTDFRQIENEYLNACRGSSQVALYGLYSSVMAPLLVPRKRK